MTIYMVEQEEKPKVGRGAKMLYVSLREGDYIMIADKIRVTYDHLEGKNHLVLGIDAPKDIEILRGKLYEEQIEKKAAQGCAEAQALSKKLKQDYKKRKRRSPHIS